MLIDYCKCLHLIHKNMPELAPQLTFYPSARILLVPSLYDNVNGLTSSSVV